MGGMNWPSDEILKNQKPATRKEKIKNLLKIFLAFADEAIIILIILYLIFR